MMSTAAMPWKGLAVKGKPLGFLFWAGLKPRAPRAAFVESDMAFKGKTNF